MHNYWYYHNFDCDLLYSCTKSHFAFIIFTYWMNLYPVVSAICSPELFQLGLGLLWYKNLDYSVIWNIRESFGSELIISNKLTYEHHLDKCYFLSTIQVKCQPLCVILEYCQYLQHNTHLREIHEGPVSQRSIYPTQRKLFLQGRKPTNRKEQWLLFSSKFRHQVPKITHRQKAKRQFAVSHLMKMQQESQPALWTYDNVLHQAHLNQHHLHWQAGNGYLDCPIPASNSRCFNCGS